MTALAAGHLGTDFADGALPALLPFLRDRFSLSYTLAAGLMLASAASSSLVQPLFGLWSDRRGASWLLPGGVAVAGVGIALASAASSYWLVVAFVLLSGLGVAAYHPEGSKFAAFASGRRRASGMSLFSIGGNVGYALGPTATTPLVVAFGLTGGLLLAVPCLVVAVLILAAVPFLASFVPESGVPAAPDREGGRALDRALDRARRHRGGGARGARGLRRPAQRHVRGGRSRGPRIRARRPAAVVAGASSTRGRAGCVGTKPGC